MRHKIKQLAEQAGFHSYITTHEEDLEMLERFADLIIKECMKVNNQIVGNKIGHIPFYVIYREHFGSK